MSRATPAKRLVVSFKTFTFFSWLLIGFGVASTQAQNDNSQPPRLKAHRTDRTWRLEWDGKAKLEWAPGPTGPWESVGVLQPPVTLDPPRSAAFFRIKRTDEEPHRAATWVLDLLPPVDGDSKAFDQTLLNFLTISVCVVQSDGTCSNRATLSSSMLQLQHNFYQANWQVPSDLVGRDLQFHLFVAGLEVGAFTQNSVSSGTLPLKFRVDDHPRLRARVLHEQGFAAKDVAAVLVSEFGLDALQTSQVLFWQQYDAASVAIALREVFQSSAESTIGLLKSLGQDVAVTMVILRDVFGETALSAAQISQRVGYACTEIAVALSIAYQLSFAEVLPIVRAAGCAPADNCEFPPALASNAKEPTANLLWFMQNVFEPLPPIAGHRDDFDTSLLRLLNIDVLEIGANGERTLVERFTADSDRGRAALSLKPNFYEFSWKPDRGQEGHNFEAQFSVAGLRLGDIPLALRNSGNNPFKFRIGNNSVIRVRVLHEQQLSAGAIGTALRTEFGLSAEDLVRLLHEESFSPGDLGVALKSAYGSTSLQAAAAVRGAGLSAVIALRMLQTGFAETNVINNVATLRLAVFTITEIWRALELVRGLKDKDIEGILLAGGFPEEAVLAVLAPRLLTKYACLIDKSGPVVYLHPDEIYHPSSVDWFLERATFVSSNGSGSNRQMVSPATLTSTARNILTNEGPTKFWLELPESARRGEIQTAKSYVHARRLKDLGMTDLQFWFFRPYNGPGTVRAHASIEPIGSICTGDAEPGNVRPLGEHTGDWEAVYLRFNDTTGGLVQAFTSQHGAEPVAYLNEITFEGTHPVFYASLNGHANYIRKDENADVAFAVCESPFYVSVSTLNRTGQGLRFPAAYEFAALDNAPLNNPWVNFPGRWGPTAPFGLTNDRKEDILRAVLGNCMDATRGAIPVACAVVCAPASAILGFGYFACLAGCTAAGEVALDPLIERFAPKVVDTAFSDQSTDGPTSPGSKTTEWLYFRYPGEVLFDVDIVEPHPTEPAIIVAGTVTVSVSVAKQLHEKDLEHHDCSTAAPPLDITPFPVAAVELALGGVSLPILSVSNSADHVHYFFQWNTAAFPDGTYTMRPRATGANGFAYQYPFGKDVVVANNSVILRLASAQRMIGEGEVYSLSGAFTDPGTNQATVRIDWGDGGVDSIPVMPPASGSEWQFTAQHAYLDDEPAGTSKDTYSVRVEVVAGEVLASATSAVTVSNKPPVITMLNVPTPLVSTGEAFQATVAFSDIGRDVHSSTWSWGDGSTETIAAAVSPLTTSHAFASPGIFTLTNVVSDDDRGSAAATFAYAVAYNPGATGGAGAGQIRATLCDTNQPPLCTTENARFGFVLDEAIGFFRVRFTLQGLDAYADRYEAAGTNASGQLVVRGPCAINGISALNVVLTNSYREVTERYLTNSMVITTNFVTNTVTRIETNTANFAFLLRATQAPSNTFQMSLTAQVGTNVVAQTLETQANQPVQAGSVIVNSARFFPVALKAAQTGPSPGLKAPNKKKAVPKPGPKSNRAPKVRK